MAFVVISQATNRWPVGTTVGAYPVSNWGTWQLPPSGAAVGAATSTAVVAADGTLTITGLTNGVEYFAAKSDGVGGYWKIKPTASPLSVYDKDNGQAGILTPGVAGWPYSTLLMTANRGYASRFVPSRNMGITLVAYHVTVAATTDDPVAVAIYDSTLATVLATSGAVTGKVNTASGLKTIPLAITLTAGTVYYVAFTYGAVGGTAATLLAANFVTASAANLFGFSAPQVAFDGKDAKHPPVGAWSTLGGASAVMPVIAVRES